MEILDYFPKRLKLILYTEFNKYYSELNEIRIRCNRPIILKIGQEERVLKENIIKEEIEELLQNICDNSIYAYQAQISSGFITIRGGHRIGISGNVVISEGRVINISHIFSLNIRIAKQIKNCSKEILSQILDREGNTIKNTLIVSPPGAGKTTILRDLIRNLSNGISEMNFKGIDVSLIDERGEIAAMFKGVPQNDIGIRTDVLNNVSKPLGIKMAVRSLAPKIIVADEIGNRNDAEAINYAVCSGVKGIFTAHGSNMQDLQNNNEINELIKLKIFKQIIFLDGKEKGRIGEISVLT